MKLSLFIHMERISPDEPQDKLYNEMMTLCEMADEAGMHAIWTGEHHGMNFTIAPNPFINLADLANRTKRVRLGTGTIIAPFNHPLRLAGEAIKNRTLRHLDDYLLQLEASLTSSLA